MFTICAYCRLLFLKTFLYNYKQLFDWNVYGMSNYIGVKCPVCNKKFTQPDDIVVCPVCGAPHHRECYAQKNTCAFASEHLSGKEWQAPASDPFFGGQYSRAGTDGGGVATCAVCQSKNPKDAIFCQVCGTRMNYDSEVPFNSPHMNLDPVTMIYGGLRPDEKIEDETARDLAVYVGMNSAYYLPKFKKIAKSSHALTFNFSALLFGFLYFFYRKMYLIGGILLGVFLIGAVPSFLQAQESLPLIIYTYSGIGSADVAIDQAKIDYYQQLVNISSMINFLIRLVLSLCANRIYYIKASGDIKQIREARPEKHDEIAYCGRLRDKGGVNKTAVIIAISVYFAVSFAAACYASYKYLLTGGFFL